MKKVERGIRCDRIDNDSVITVYEYLRRLYDFTVLDLEDEFSLLELRFTNKKFIDEYGNNIVTYSTIKIPKDYVYNTAIVIDLEEFYSLLNNWEKDILKKSNKYLEIYQWCGPAVLLPINTIDDVDLIDNYLKSIDKITS